MGAVVLLSGGLDSSTCLALAVNRHGADAVEGVSFRYGQKHEREVEHAAAVAAYFGTSHRITQLPDVFAGSGSALLQGRPDGPNVPYESLPDGESPAYVPFRNGVLLSLAAAVALTVGAEELYFGAHSEDASRWAYPDCTPEFIGSFAAALHVGSGFKVRLVSPLQWMTKAEVVRLGVSLEVPFHLTTSCYAGTSPACGVCPTCRSRRQAFASNGLRDPIAYVEA
jgi:7-cyano-7-deazaguanine synthase